MLNIERHKKALKIFCPKTWCTKKPFGYRVAHDGYLLTSYPGQEILNNKSTNQLKIRKLRDINKFCNIKSKL